MACDCSNYIDCEDPRIEVGTADEVAGFTHTYTNEVTVTNLPFLFTSKIDRTFSVSYGWDRSIDITHVLKGDCSATVKEMSCGNVDTAKSASSQSESCVVEINIPYHIDRQRGVYVWKNVKETLQWTSTSTDTAKFKLKFGLGYFHKICVPNTIKTKGKETFFLHHKGVIEELASAEYEYNPFPETEGGGSTWGLYGNTIQQTAEPDTPNVAMILLFPLVPKQAIPQDNDVIAYGFYDYNATAGGFTETSLPEDDGGKDYFYPYWLRQMPIDSVWRSTADTRYDVIYSTGKMNLAGTTSWVQPEPQTNPYPFGSFCLDSEENFIASCLLEFGTRLDSKGVVYNRSSFGDLFKALTDIGLPRKEFTKVDPVSLI